MALLTGSASAASISVDTTSDGIANDGNCTLREAVNAATTNAVVDECDAGDAGAVDTITLDSAGTYQLAGAAGDDNNASGDLDINPAGADAGLTIQGDPAGVPGQTEDAIGQAGLTDRVLDIITGGPVTLNTVTIQNGAPPGIAEIGGGIEHFNGIPLTLVGSIVRASDALGGGGGIGSVGPLTVTDSVIGGSSASDANTARVGGGIMSVSGLAVTRSVIRGNVATFPADGDFDLVVGGGISTNSTNTTITDSTITGNKAAATEAMDAVIAGGMDAGNANLTMTGSTVSGNTLTGGTNATAAGIRLTGANPTSSTILNSTISGNSVGAGAGVRAVGGLQVDTGAVLTLAQSTVTGNTSPSAPSGIASNGLAAPITLRGDLIDQGADGCTNVPTAFAADAYNVDAGTSCVGATDDNDLENAAPIALGGLANNNGPTSTHALGSTSVAIDAVPAAACTEADGITPLTVDQRGAERPSDAGCDAGAYERVTCGGQQPNILGGPGDDVFVGNSLNTVIAGSGGNDQITGFDENDTLCGGSGNDTLVGGGSFNIDLADFDVLLGGPGDDTINSRDGFIDTVDCGPGNDTATVDKETDNVTNCETILPPDAPVCLDPAICPGAAPPPEEGDTDSDSKRKCKKKKKKGNKRSAVASKKKKKCKKKKKHKH